MKTTHAHSNSRGGSGIKSAGKTQGRREADPDDDDAVQQPPSSRHKRSNGTSSSNHSSLSKQSSRNSEPDPDHRKSLPPPGRAHIATASLRDDDDDEEYDDEGNLVISKDHFSTKIKENDSKKPYDKNLAKKNHGSMRRTGGNDGLKKYPPPGQKNNGELKAAAVASAAASVNNNDDDFPSELEGDVPWTLPNEDVDARNNRMKNANNENARLKSEAATGPRSVPLPPSKSNHIEELEELEGDVPWMAQHENITARQERLHRQDNENAAIKSAAIYGVGQKRGGDTTSKYGAPLEEEKVEESYETAQFNYLKPAYVASSGDGTKEGVKISPSLNSSSVRSNPYYVGAVAITPAPSEDSVAAPNNNDEMDGGLLDTDNFSTENEDTSTLPTESGTVDEEAGTSYSSPTDGGGDPSMMNGQYGSDPNADGAVHAIIVDDEEEALDRRLKEVLGEAVTAKAVDPNARKRRLAYFGVIGLALVIGIIVLIVLFTRKDGSGGPTNSPTSSPTATPIPTLQAVRERKVLKCGVPNKQGFSVMNTTTGLRDGFEIDSCRAVAAAVLGAGYKIETMELSAAERFLALANKSIDVLARVTTHTMERDVHQTTAKTGFTFTVPYLYDGLGFGGKPDVIDCADNIKTTGECSVLKICVAAGTTHQKILKGLFPGGALLETNDQAENTDRFINNDCNVLSGEQTDIAEVTVRLNGYQGEYQVGKKLISKEPLAMVTRDDDNEWSQIVDLVLQAQFAAEAMNITQENANDFPRFSFFGEEYDRMFVNAIAAVGNYGERYERHLEKIIPRQGLNLLNLDEEYVDTASNNTLGLIYSHPWGSIDVEGPPPPSGSRLDMIKNQGENLICGMTQINPGFASFDANTQAWTGLDADYCAALAAAISGDFSDVEYVDLTESQEKAFEALETGKVDVLSGVNIDIKTNVEKDVSYSQAYYYDGSSSTRALATSNNDPQFSDFVWWIVTATFYAEEQGVTQQNSNDMPSPKTFGPGFDRMFRDAILAEGNYGEMYTRNVEPVIPRAGRNQLNNPATGPQINPFVGFFLERE